ncbi:outer membrane beta-barrel protein [Sphingobium sufflavum]|jgi:outer membrane immunogenic protein|uniref:outer membrane beta-barrel protein n=1 Tax=Sphingobium sufflavum TaxID=1129547 RepID=UPI001F39F831|nr:outer membrane beta-barrel protein [Sphingobium sufflavum]MCE7796170.1 outer membrane beta-barrel protein [Sphingobium sufflavum]
MKFIIATAALAVSLATPAFAQDGEKTPFNGPFVGAILGYDNVRGAIPAGPSAKREGLLYGGVLGYDVNLNGAVIGVEGEFTDSDTKYNVGAASLRTDRDLYAGARLGGQVTQNVLLYAKGGYTNARFELHDSTGGTFTKTGQNLDGYRLGAGVETTYRGLTGRVEYRYSDYGKYQGVNLNRHQVAAVLGYRF